MANDFSSDENCVALWRFESGTLTTDSMGTNTLTDYNTVHTQTGAYKEGSACAEFQSASSEALYCLDANLSAGFPLKAGDTNKKFSICAWIYWVSLSDNDAPFGKWNTVDTKRVIIPIRILNVSGTYRWQSYIGYNSGASSEKLYEGGTPTTGRWYHFGMTYEDSSKAWKLRIWDDSAGSVVVNASGNSTNNINVEDALIVVGCPFGASFPGGDGFMDGYIDEMVVFNDILTVDEIDAIRAGTYNVLIGKTSPMPLWFRS